MKAQSAMEYMMTYGWAIVIIAIALAALIALGVFNPGIFVGQECIVQAGFSCLNYVLSSNGTLMINLEQATEAPINITALGCNTNVTTMFMQQPDNPPSNQVYMPIGSNYTFDVQCYSFDTPFNGTIGQLYKGNLVINYTDTLTGFPHVAYGTIIDKVTK